MAARISSDQPNSLHILCCAYFILLYEHTGRPPFRSGTLASSIAGNESFLFCSHVIIDRFSLKILTNEKLHETQV